MSSDESNRGLLDGREKPPGEAKAPQEATAHALVVLTIVASNIAFCFLYLWGLKIFPLLAAHCKNISLLSYAGDGLILLGLLLLGVFYVFELPNQLNTIVWVIFFLASLLLGVQSPWASPLCVFMFMLSKLLAIRASHRDVQRASLMLTGGLTFLFCGLLVLFGWLAIGSGRPTLAHLQESVRAMSQSKDAKWVYAYFDVNYARDCLGDGPSSDKLTEAIVKRKANCAAASNVIVITWAIPFATACLDLAFGAFGLLVSVFFVNLGADPNETELKQVAGVFFLLNSFLWGGLYASSYTLQVSVSLTMPLLGSLFVAAVIALRWVFLEKCAMQGHQEGDCPCPKVEEFTKKVKDSAWLQALAVGSLFVPTFMLLEGARQCRRRQPSESSNSCCGMDAKREKLDKQAGGLYKEIMEWEPAPILICICILGEIFFVLQVLGTKFTYVFLAGMNETLTDQPLLYAMGLAFAVGLFMLLLPPVPGVPVYIFCGIVVAKQGKEELSFAGGCAAAVVLSLVLKLLACTVQYYIGVSLGHWPSVRRFIGVGTPATTSIMSILNQKFSMNKVAILVGGPDWPTSVACGILGINLGWMLVGTLPCLLTASPCVLAGAFLADKGEGEGGKVHDFLGSFFTLLAAVVQTGSLLWATKAINEELNKPPEAETTSTEPAANHRDGSGDQEADRYDEEYEKTIKWDSLSRPMKVALSAAASFILLTGYAFAILGGMLFENFSVSGKIGDKVDEFGLGGDALAIVKTPGWVAIVFCVLGMGLHLLFYLLTHHKTREVVNSQNHGGN